MNVPIGEYNILVKVIDFLINQEVISDRITMKGKSVLAKNTFLGDQKMIKLTFGPQRPQEN